MNSLSVYGERFFVRLIMKADDYGCYHADARLLKSFLFPLLPDGVREADISRWLGECEKAGLIALYESSGKKYLQIQDFRQRLDKARHKFPLPESGNSLPASTDFPAETERETEEERNAKVTGSDERNALHVGLAPSMVASFLLTFPKYPVDKAKDFSSCLAIGYTIADQKGISKFDAINGRQSEVLAEWDRIIAFIASDKWFKKRSLSDLCNEWQRLMQSYSTGVQESSPIKAASNSVADQLRKARQNQNA